MKTTAEKIAVMQAFEEGRAIECRWLEETQESWMECSDPIWRWPDMDYRVAAAKPDSIDWDAVHPKYKWMARNENGICRLFTEKPESANWFWFIDMTELSAFSIYDSAIPAIAFTSYKPGGLPWNESLVERPEHKGE